MSNLVKQSSAVAAPMFVNCPACSASLTVAGAGQWSCPTCQNVIDVTAPALQAVASYTPPQTLTPVRAVRVRETNGGGIALEVLGVLLCLTGVGIIIGIPLIIVGGRMALALRCGQCGNGLVKTSTVCPSCKCAVGKPKSNTVLLAILAAIIFGSLWAVWRLM